jgi:metallo-beta-lactamase family protein
MLRLLECQDKAKIKRIFLVHGEYETQKSFKEIMLEHGYNNIDIPDYKEVYNL